jgi:hypothetical protein
MMDDSAFDRLIARAARDIRYPATPSLRARVHAAVAPPPPRVPRGFLRPAVLAAACVIAVAVAVVLAVPSSRSAIAEFFGVRGSQVNVAPTPAAGVTPTPFPTPAGLEQYGTAATTDEATRALGFAPPMPSGAGAPGRMFVINYFNSMPVVVLSFARYDLWIAKPDEGGVFVKTLDPDARLGTPLVHGQPANWVSGGSHIVTFTDAQGNEAAGAQRTVTRNTLVWRTDAAFYRLETDLPEDGAIAVAESLP